MVIHSLIDNPQILGLRDDQHINIVNRYRVLSIRIHNRRNNQGHLPRVNCVQHIGDGRNNTVLPDLQIRWVPFGMVKKMFKEITLEGCYDTARSAFDLLEAVVGGLERGEEDALYPGFREGF